MVSQKTAKFIFLVIGVYVHRKLSFINQSNACINFIELVIIIGICLTETAK